MIRQKEDPTTGQLSLAAYIMPFGYTHDGIELGEVTNQEKVASGQIKIEFAFARSGNLQIAFQKKQESKGEHDASHD